MTQLIFRAVNAWARLRHPHLCLSFRRRTGQWPNVALPQSLPERFLWRKIFDHNPVFAEISDKLRVKAFAHRMCPEIGVPKVLWQGTDLADAPPELLNRPGMLKANHACRMNVPLPDADRDLDAMRRLTAGWLAEPYGQRWGEWAYSAISRKIFIEELLQNDDGSPLEEIKVHACAGEPLFITYFRGTRNEDLTAEVFTLDGQRTGALDDVFAPTADGKPPAGWEKAVEVARVLSAPFDFIRVDLLLANGKLYIGELTVYPLSGFTNLHVAGLPERWRAAWDLRKSWFLSAPQPGWRGLYARALRARLDARAAGQSGG